MKIYRENVYEGSISTILKLACFFFLSLPLDPRWHKPTSAHHTSRHHHQLSAIMHEMNGVLWSCNGPRKLHPSYGRAGMHEHKKGHIKRRMV